MNLEELEKRIQELENWKVQKERQQITEPLDEVSRKILQKDLMVVTGYGEFLRASGMVGDYFYFVDVNGKKERLSVNFPNWRFTADASTDVITIEGVDVNNNQAVVLMTAGTMPGGLSPQTPYYVVNASGNTCKLSASMGGSPINITSAGSGMHYLTYY